jgi:hypothetical protein
MDGYITPVDVARAAGIIVRTAPKYLAALNAISVKGTEKRRL